MPEKDRSELRWREGKIEGRTSSTASGLCLHIGFGGATALSACAAIQVSALIMLELLRCSPAQARWSSHAARS